MKPDDNFLEDTYNQGKYFDDAVNRSLYENECIVHIAMFILHARSESLDRDESVVVVH